METRPKNEIENQNDGVQKRSTQEKPNSNLLIPFSDRPLVKHIRFFGGGDLITRKTIKDKNYKMGDSTYEANKNATLVSMLAGIEITGCPFSSFTPEEGAEFLRHSHSTGIYDENFNIDEEVWNELLTYSQKMNDEQQTSIMTKTDFDRFLKERRRKQGATNLSGKVKSDGEWDKYWLKFGVNNVNPPYVTIKKLRDFFEDSAIVGVELEEKVRHSI